MTDKTYTQEQIDDLMKQAIHDNEARHFEEATLEFIKETNRRLTESNGYKSILKDIQIQIKGLQDQATATAVHQKEQKEAKEKWFQDWYLRIGIIGTIVWEIVNIVQSMQATGILQGHPK